MRRRGVPFVRYVDDLVMFCQSENDFLMLADEIAAQLGHLGQDLNWAKNEYHNCDADVSDVARASLDDESDFEGEGKSSDLRAALEAGDEGRVRFLLGGLRFNADPSGIAPLVKYRWAIRELPRQTVQYLGVVRDAIDDWAWLHEELLAGHEPRRAAGALQIARMLGRAEIPSSLGATMFELALGLDSRSLGPLRSALFVAAAKSEERAKVKTKRALEVLDGCGDAGERRALVGSLKACGSLNGSTKRAIRHARRCSYDLAPTAEWILAA